LNLSEFLILFPEFSEKENIATKYPVAIELAKAGVGCFDNKIHTALSIAHVLVLREQIDCGSGGIVLSVKSKDDAITYSKSKNALYDWLNTTLYGQILANAIQSFNRFNYYAI
jgi:hypothetical protein